MTFLDRFSPIEFRERKLVEFMNLCQRVMSVKDYSLKFTQLSKCAPIVVANSRARINKFVMGVCSLMEEVCRMAMLYNDIDNYRLMVYLQ